MALTVVIVSGLLILLSILPFIQHQHWIFRVAEFTRLQFLFLQVIVFAWTFFYIKSNPLLWFFQFIQFLLILYHSYVLIKYTRLWRTKKFEKVGGTITEIKLVSCNIYQFNKAYGRFVELIKKEQPDIFLTMESNSGWEKAMRILEKEYPNNEKVTLENTYGMHFYTKLKMHSVRTHFFVAGDVPSIEAELEDREGRRFVFFGVHPPPPSPTEEKNSKERDGDLLSVARKVRDYTLPVVVAGDFNNVAWAKSSILFKKTSKLIDARIGRGILATFHACYWFFRVPLDLLFHSTDVFIDKLFIYPSVGSDHFPVGCTFHINEYSREQEEEVMHLEHDEMQEVDELIEAGREETSDNRSKERGSGRRSKSTVSGEVIPVRVQKWCYHRKPLPKSLPVWLPISQAGKSES